MLAWLLFFLLLPVWTLSSESHLLNQPLYYGDIFFSQPNQKSIAKYQISGKELWRLDYTHVEQKEILFNCLFLRTSKGDLFVIESQTGSLKWERTGEEMSAFFVQYPYVFCWRDRLLYCLDFFSGQELWKQDLSASITMLHPLGHSGKLIVLDKTNTFRLIDLSNGQTLSNLQPPTSDSKLVTSWNDGFLFADNDFFYVFDNQEKKFHALNISSNTLFALRNRYHLIYFDTKTDELKSFNLTSLKQSWAITTSNVSHLSLYQDHLLVADKSQATILDATYAKTKTTFKLPTSFQTDPIAGFSFFNDQLYLYHTDTFPELVSININEK